MQPIAWLGISPDDLNERVIGRVWEGRVELEPDLSRFSGLGGHGDELAAIALAHQLERGPGV